MKIAIVHDWLVTYAGAEKVLEQMLEVFPEADIFSLVDFLDEKDRGFIKNKKVSTTFVQ
ncbi:glycosyltransferase family 4 protein, partial [Pseudomonas aeruginosa]